MNFNFSFLSILLCFFCTSCFITNRQQESINYAHGEVSFPQKFAEQVVSSEEASEFDMCFSPDGKTVFFTRRFATEKQKIWQANFEKGRWVNPQPLPFSTDRDETPFLSPDGKTLYFGSTRPIEQQPSKGSFDMNIWEVENKQGGWGTPKPLSLQINKLQKENEQWPSSNENFIYSLDGINFIYSTMMRGEKSIEVYLTRKEGDDFTTPQMISGLFADDKIWKYSAVLSPDGQYLLFNSYGLEGGKGREDIYISKKINNQWSAARNLGDLVNTPAEESSPRFSPDGKYFFFARETRINQTEDGKWDIYFVETKYLNFKKLFEN